MRFLKKKTQTKHVKFHVNGTYGREKHAEFIKEVNDKQIKIINSWTEYYDRSTVPSYVNYIIQK